MFQPAPFHERRPGLVAPVRVDPQGLTGPTRGEARSKRWRRSSYGLYVPTSAESGSAEQRIVEAAAVLQPGDGVTGWAALHWQGARWFTGILGDGSPRDVPLMAFKHLLAQPGFVVNQDHRRPGEVIVVDGLH